MLVAALQKQRKDMESENARLIKEMRKLKDAEVREQGDKRKYMEGAVWMGRRMTTEIERVCQGFESLAQEYINRFKALERTLDATIDRRAMSAADVKNEMELLQMQRAQVWFLEAVKQSGFELYERTITMLEGALHHQNEAQDRVVNYSPNK